MLIAYLPRDGDRSSVILMSVEVLSFPGELEQSQFPKVVRFPQVTSLEVEVYRSAPSFKHLLSPWWKFDWLRARSIRDNTDAAALFSPLFSLLCFLFSRSVCQPVSLSCFLPSLYLPPVALPTHPLLPPPSSFSPRDSFFLSVCLLLHLQAWLIALTKFA